MNLETFEWHDLPLSSLRINEDSIEFLVTPLDKPSDAYFTARLTVTQPEHLSVSITAQMPAGALGDLEITTFEREHHNDGRVSGTIGILPGNHGYWTISFVRARCVLERVV